MERAGSGTIDGVIREQCEIIANTDPQAIARKLSMLCVIAIKSKELGLPDSALRAHLLEIDSEHFGIAEHVEASRKSEQRDRSEPYLFPGFYRAAKRELRTSDGLFDIPDTMPLRGLMCQIDALRYSMMGQKRGIMVALMRMHLHMTSEDLDVGESSDEAEGDVEESSEEVEESSDEAA